jgi:hypothetical protein
LHEGRGERRDDRLLASEFSLLVLELSLLALELSLFCLERFILLF